MLLAACEQFLSKNEEQIQQVALETLEGHQRAIMGSMTVEVSHFFKILYFLPILKVAKIEYCQNRNSNGSSFSLVSSQDVNIIHSDLDLCLDCQAFKVQIKTI